ncbi:hypothetical protein J6590_008454 [Homalodisca vitripennis]|nr:hypothetical protein J6590_008454 [Homalodisca vitripennis]
MYAHVLEVRGDVLTTTRPEREENARTRSRSADRSEREVWMCRAEVTLYSDLDDTVWALVCCLFKGSALTNPACNTNSIVYLGNKSEVRMRTEDGALLAHTHCALRSAVAGLSHTVYRASTVCLITSTHR